MHLLGVYFLRHLRLLIPLPFTLFVSSSAFYASAAFLATSPSNFLASSRSLPPPPTLSRLVGICCYVLAHPIVNHLHLPQISPIIYCNAVSYNYSYNYCMQ